MVQLYVTLTNTTNEYLKPQLPLRGFLSIHELTIGHTVNTNGATFHAEAADGKSLRGAAVSAPNAEFFCDRAYPSQELLDALNRRDGKGRWARHEGNDVPTSVARANFLWSTGAPNSWSSVSVKRTTGGDGSTKWRDHSGEEYDVATIDAWEPHEYL